MSRSIARQAAMQLLYERMSGGNADDESLDLIYEQLSLAQTDTDAKPLKPSHSEREYITGVMNGVLEHQTELDDVIKKYSSGSWSLDRVAHVDLSILRLAVYEMYYLEKIPDSVSISEAVSMAKIYSEPKSSRYINGVLGSLERDKQEET